MYYDQCQFHFSDKDAILAVTGDDSNFPWTTTYAWNMNNVSRGNVAAFDALVERLVVAVADAATNAVGRYGTGQAGFPPEATNVYALAQCTPDLTPEQCWRCLSHLFVLGMMHGEGRREVLGGALQHRDGALLCGELRHSEAHASSGFVVHYKRQRLVLG